MTAVYMANFPEDIHFNIGKYVEMFVDILQDWFGVAFEAIGTFVLISLMYIQDFLLWIPWWVFIGILFLLSWWLLSFWSGVLFSVMMFMIGTFQLWDLTIITLALVIISVFISIVIGIPIGILMAYSRLFQNFMKPILDFMQTMPAFVYLIPAIILFGLGFVPAVIATLIYALPPIIRLTNLAIRGVSFEMVEAADSFGSSRWQLLKKVQLPQALPTIMTGINQTTMMALSMVVVASMVGAEGLGLEVFTAINRIDISKGFEAGISIVFIAVIVDRLTAGIGKRFEIQK